MTELRKLPNRRTRPARLLLAVTIAVGLAACDDPPVDAELAVPQVAEKSQDMARWQAVKDNTPVALFLARVASNDPNLQPGSDAVPHYANLLQDARQHYIETPRMISNRLIQGGDYLIEKGTPMPLDTLLIEIESVGGKEPRSFADDLHHYINLRDAGADHQAAIADLARASERR